MERKAKAATESGVLLLVIAGILVAVNAISAFGGYKRIDTTKSEKYTLSRGSANLLKSVKKDKIKVDAYVTKGLPKLDAFVRDLRDLLIEYQTNSGGKFEFRIVEAKEEKDKEAAKDAQCVQQPFGEAREEARLVPADDRQQEAAQRVLHPQRQGSGGEEVYLRHIVVRTGGPEARSAADACMRIEEARAEIETGTEFQEVARRVTEMNPEREGELGWIHHDELASWMEGAIAKLGPGQLSATIEMPFGCNLLELVDRRPFKRITFEEAQPQLRNIIFQEKTEAEYVKWIDVLRKQTHVDKKGSFGG